MSTTAQFILDRATTYSTANQGITTDPIEALMVIRKDQRTIFARCAAQNRDYFATSATLSASTGSAGRIMQLPPNCARVLQLLIASTMTPVSIIDITDPTGDLAPRGSVFGQTIVEVGNDWSAAPGSVAMLLYYVQGPTDISPSGDLTQLISLPDDWSHLLVLRLALYYAGKDLGRDPQEIQRLDTQCQSAEQDFLSFITEQGGIKGNRFRIPTPSTGGQPGVNK